jgi:hypothetical protein
VASFLRRASPKKFVKLIQYDINMLLSFFFAAAAATKPKLVQTRITFRRTSAREDQGNYTSLQIGL